MLSRRALLLAMGPQMFGDAEAYEKFMGRWSRRLAPLLVQFADPPDGGRILDCGSGTGALTAAILAASRSARVTGIDVSREYVAYASARNRSPKRAVFQEADAQRLPFLDAAFQASLSLLVFNFIPDASKAVSELRRVTAPGGRVTAAVWDYGEGMRMLQAFWNAAVRVDPSARERAENRMPLCRQGELSALWRQGGLQEVEETPLQLDMRFRNFADFWDPFLLRQGPAGVYAASLDKSQRERLRDALMREVGASSDTSPFNLPARAWAVRGVVPRR